jgi:hypothetical protein
MDETLKDRKIELERQSHVASVEADSLSLEVNESKTFRLMDLESYQRIRARFFRINKTTGKSYGLNINGNNIIVTRIK